MTAGAAAGVAAGASSDYINGRWNPEIIGTFPVVP